MALLSTLCTPPLRGSPRSGSERHAHVSLEWVTGAEIKGRAAPRALGVGGGVKEGEEFELRREVKCLRYKEQQPVGGSRGLQQPGTLLVRGKCWLGCPPHPT